jgi:hypothetical protein
MGISPKPTLPQSASVEFFPRFRAAVAILREGYEYAPNLERSVWDIVVEIHVMRATSLTNSDLRCLVCKLFPQHAAEINRAGKDIRAFRRTAPPAVTKRTCFVLTETGAVHLCHGHDAVTQSGELPQLRSVPNFSRQVPEWDKERQELRVGDLVVKQLTVRAPNQELILESFQVKGWSPRIDDPFPPHLNQVSKQRLYDTINRHHKHRLIRFSGDGSAKGVRHLLISPRPRWNGAS